MNSDYKPNEYLYLHNVGIFQIIDNDGEGDCLFRSISQALYKNSQKHHTKIRKLVSKHLTKCHLWQRFGERIISFWRLDSIPIKHLGSPQRNWRRYFQLNPTGDRERMRENKWKYRQLMSQGAFPGTSYELRAAADLFGFHVDFLLDMSSPRQLQNASDKHIRLYEIFSCRNNGCQVPIGEQYPHLYYIHRKTSRNCQGGHWQLIFPMLLLRNTMPLHRKIYAVSSIGCRLLNEADVNDKRDLIMRMNEIGQQVDDLVSRGRILPFEDPEWPSDDRDDFLGCAQLITYVGRQIRGDN